MNDIVKCSKPTPLSESLWLVVQLAQQRSVFALRADEQRSLVFGSSPEADFRIQGAPAVAFHLERDEDGVWLNLFHTEVKLRTRAQRQGGRYRLHDCAFVELAGLIVVLWIRDSAPTLGSGDRRVADDSASPVPEHSRSSFVAREYAELIMRKRAAKVAASHQGVASTEARDIAVFPQGLEVPSTEGDPLDSDLWFNGWPTSDADEPWSARCDETETMNLGVLQRSSFNLTHTLARGHLTYLLARLGVTAKRHPICVLFGVALGALVLTAFMAGATQLLG